MTLTDLPPELVNEIAYWLHPRCRYLFSFTCKRYWKQFEKDRALYAKHHNVYCTDVWQAILNNKTEYIDEISSGARWEQPSYVPSWDEFCQLNFPQDWLALDLKSDLEQQKFTPVLVYLVTKAPNLGILEFEHQNDLKYLVNVLPRLQCQLTHIQITRPCMPLNYEIDVGIIHVFLDISTLKELHVEGIRSEDYRADMALQTSHTPSGLEKLDLEVYDVGRSGLQFLDRLSNLRCLKYYDRSYVLPGRYILQHVPKCIKTIYFNADGRRDDNNEEVAWDEFECLETLRTAWEDVSLEQLPTTLRNVILGGFDDAVYDKVSAALPWISRRCPQLESLQVNEETLYPV